VSLSPCLVQPACFFRKKSSLSLKKNCLASNYLALKVLVWEDGLASMAAIIYRGLLKSTKVGARDGNGTKWVPLSPA